MIQLLHASAMQASSLAPQLLGHLARQVDSSLGTFGSLCF